MQLVSNRLENRPSRRLMNILLRMSLARGGDLLYDAASGSLFVFVEEFSRATVKRAIYLV
jgi:hypothetical protein